MNQRDTSLFGSKPGILVWERWGEWEFVSSPDAPSDEAAMSDLLNPVIPDALIGLELDNPVITIPGSTRYMPLTDTPRAYRVFFELGEKAWADPAPSIPELAELALEFTREYGTLGGVLTLEDIIDEAKTVAWVVKSYVGVAERGEAAAKAAETFFQRLEAKHGHGWRKSAPEGEDELRRFITVVLGGVVNRHMQTYSVWSQIQPVLGDPTQTPGFEPTYEPSSLRAAIWVQLASLLMRKSELRRCEYNKCGKIFEATSRESRQEYCPPPTGKENSGCQVKAKGQRRYANRLAAKRLAKESKPAKVSE